MVCKACLPSNAYYPRTPDYYTLYSGVHVCWSEHSDSSFIYGFMRLIYGLGTMTTTTTSQPDASYQVSSQLAFQFSRRSKNRFSSWMAWWQSWISDQSVLAIFDLQVTPMLPTKFQVKWHFRSGEEAKNRFSRWPPMQPSWISDPNDFSYFWSTSHPDASYQVWSQLAFWFMRRSKK